MDRDHRRRRLAFLGGMLAAAAVIVAVVIGLGQAGSGGSDAPALPAIAEQQQRLAGAPEPLAALHRDGGRLLDGDVEARLRGLRGHPVVINKWASWCGPCRLELPIVGELALELGRRVAFLGLDSEDPDRRAARGLLANIPLSFPSYRDPSGERARAIGFGRSAFPSTLYLDERGRVSYVHQGAYATVADMRADIERYLTARR